MLCRLRVPTRLLSRIVRSGLFAWAGSGGERGRVLLQQQTPTKNRTFDHTFTLRDDLSHRGYPVLNVLFTALVEKGQDDPPTIRTRGLARNNSDSANPGGKTGWMGVGKEERRKKKTVSPCLLSVLSASVWHPIQRKVTVKSRNQKRLNCKRLTFDVG